MSIPSLLDPSICPPGTHVFHAFSPDWIDAWAGLAPAEYEARKERVADEVVARLEKIFPGLKAATRLRQAQRRGTGSADFPGRSLMVGAAVPSALGSDQAQASA